MNQKDIEAKADELYNKLHRATVAEGTTIAIAAIAFSMLYQDATRELILASLDAQEAAEARPMVNVIVNERHADAHNQIMAAGNEFLHPALSSDTFIMDPAPGRH